MDKLYADELKDFKRGSELPLPLPPYSKGMKNCDFNYLDFCKPEVVELLETHCFTIFDEDNEPIERNFLIRTDTFEFALRDCEGTRCTKDTNKALNNLLRYQGGTIRKVSILNFKEYKFFAAIRNIMEAFDIKMDTVEKKGQTLKLNCFTCFCEERSIVLHENMLNENKFDGLGEGRKFDLEALLTPFEC